MADPNLRCQVANATVAALPPIPDGTCSSDIAIDMADVMLSTHFKADKDMIDALVHPEEEKGGGGAGGSNCRRASPGDAALGHALR